jgi:acylphosphatase
VRGRVQGVGFRQFVMHHANKLALSGWVRNSHFSHSLVELEAEGPRQKLETLLELVRKGPSASHVEQVIADWFDPEGETRQWFEIR